MLPEHSDLQREFVPAASPPLAAVLPISSSSNHHHATLPVFLSPEEMLRASAGCEDEEETSCVNVPGSASAAYRLSQSMDHDHLPSQSAISKGKARDTSLARPPLPNSAMSTDGLSMNAWKAHQFSNSGTPGGDCARLCVRHQRMVDGGHARAMQKSIENLSEADQNTVNTIWSLFSSSRGSLRQLTLRGMLSISCPSQLSFLTEQLKAECRIDPFLLLPREIFSKCLAHLDATSLCRAAQVSRSWRAIADDDMLWRNMCEQHIERKCEKCGWGLPLLEKKRRARASALAAGVKPKYSHDPVVLVPAPAQYVPPASSMQGSTSPRILPPLPADYPVPDAPPPHRPGGQTTNSSFSPSLPQASTSRDSSKVRRVPDDELEGLSLEQADESHDSDCQRPSKRSRRSTPQEDATMGNRSPVSSRSISRPATPRTRPWKAVYSERLVIEKNWRKGSCQVTTFTGHEDAITCLQVEEALPHPNFPVLMTGSWDRSVRIWNLETGQQIGILYGHTRGVRALQFDVNKLITGSMDKTIKIWTWRTGECIRTLEGHRDAVICLTAERNLLVSGSADSTIRVWDFEAGSVVALRGHTEWVNKVVIWSPETACLPVDHKTGNILVSSQGKPLEHQVPPLPPAQQPLKLLFSASDDGQIRVWDLRYHICVRVLESHVAQVQSLQVITIDETHNGVAQPRFPALQNGSTSSQSQSDNQDDANNDNSNVNNVSPRSRNLNDLARLQAMQRQATLAAPNVGNVPMGLMPANQVPVGGAPHFLLQQQQARLAAQQTQQQVQQQQQQQLPDLGLTTSKPVLVSCALDNTVKMWDVETGANTKTMFGHVQGVWDVAMDKLRISSASHDGTIKIWDRETGRCQHTLVGHRGAVTALRMTDDKIISGGDDSQIFVYDFGPRSN